MAAVLEHEAMTCSVGSCMREAWVFLELGDLFVPLCDVHEDLCAECLRSVDESIAWEGNVCGSCLEQNSESYAELGMYQCRPECATCRARWT